MKFHVVHTSLSSTLINATQLDLLDKKKLGARGLVHIRDRFARSQEILVEVETNMHLELRNPR